MAYLKRENLTKNGKKWDDKVRKENRQLLYAGGEIRFQSEENLEYYIEDNFEKLFPDLYLVRRQYTINRQRCDLLCRSKLSKQPVIIELKNEEDRGLISQLTRYRKALLIEKPFAEQIDYSLPAKLIAIAPTFHEDNYTDREASKFEDDFCLWEFSIENEKGEGKFKLCGQTYYIDYPILGLSGEVFNTELNYGSLPAFTQEFVCRLDIKFREYFGKLRLKFLCQPKVKEMVSGSYRKILFGTGDGKTHKKLAEITNTGNGINLFLWLPTRVRTNIKVPVTRFGFVLAANENPLSDDSQIEWIVCTKGTVNLKYKELSFNRNGMPKWDEPSRYLYYASLNSYNTFSLLTYLLMGMTPDAMSDEDRAWWNSYKTKTPTNLGWYIDLAIKTCNYRIK